MASCCLLEKVSQNSWAYYSSKSAIWLQPTFPDSLPICLFKFNKCLSNARHYGRRQRPLQDPWPDVRERNINNISVWKCAVGLSQRHTHGAVEAQRGTFLEEITTLVLTISYYSVFWECHVFPVDPLSCDLCQKCPATHHIPGRLVFTLKYSLSHQSPSPPQ